MQRPSEPDFEPRDAAGRADGRSSEQSRRGTGQSPAAHEPAGPQGETAAGPAENEPGTTESNSTTENGVNQTGSSGIRANDTGASDAAAAPSPGSEPAESLQPNQPQQPGDQQQGNQPQQPGPAPSRPGVHYDGTYYEPAGHHTSAGSIAGPRPGQPSGSHGEQRGHTWTVPDAWDEARPAPRRRRRWKLPVVLFLLTCLSTFWAGAAGDYVLAIFGGLPAIAHVLANTWQDGLIYMATVLAILLAHEMGHFILTLRHGIAASYPLFIPMPLTPIGTMGAVIAMQGSQADRKQLFDIGIAGPLAGLVVAVPVVCYGILHAPAKLAPTVITYHNPLGMELLIAWLRPDVGPHGVQMTPMLMAGWVGLLVTGLNMLPVSQLDGGHVAYALLGRRAHMVARALVAGAVIYVVVAGNYGWILMLILVMLIGVAHPPTRDDRVPLGRVRQVVGYASLVIPVLCFPPQVISVDESLVRFSTLAGQVFPPVVMAVVLR